MVTSVIDMDITIAYDEVEQEASDVMNELPPSEPEVMLLEPGLDSLDLDLLFVDNDLVPEDSSFPEESMTKEEPVSGDDAQLSPEIAEDPVLSCDEVTPDITFYFCELVQVILVNLLHFE